MELPQRKSGPRVIDLNLERHKSGVRVDVKVIPAVEEFFQYWGGGVPEPPGFGRMWHPLESEKDKPLLVWTFQTNLALFDKEVSYSIYPVGAGFFFDDRLNISFLRLVGASEGRSFLWDAVISRMELDKLGARMQRAAEDFYIEYIQQVKVNIFVGVDTVTQNSEAI